MANDFGTKYIGLCLCLHLTNMQQSTFLEIELRQWPGWHTSSPARHSVSAKEMTLSWACDWPNRQLAKCLPEHMFRTFKFHEYRPAFVWCVETHLQLKCRQHISNYVTFHVQSCAHAHFQFFFFDEIPPKLECTVWFIRLWFNVLQSIDANGVFPMSCRIRLWMSLFGTVNVSLPKFSMANILFSQIIWYLCRLSTSQNCKFLHSNKLSRI